jgi:hypothetical protein
MKPCGEIQDRGDAANGSPNPTVAMKSVLALKGETIYNPIAGCRRFGG